MSLDHPEPFKPRRRLNGVAVTDNRPNALRSVTFTMRSADRDVFDGLAKRRGLAAGALGREITLAINAKPELLDLIFPRNAK